MPMPAQNPSFDSFLSGVGVKPDTEESSILETRRKKVEEATAPVESASFQLPPTPQQHDPLDTFGSSAGWIAAFGSLLTRHPLTTALDASAAAMNATKAGDAAANKQAIERWKENNTVIMDRARFEMEAYKNAKSDGELHMLAQAYQNPSAATFARLGQGKEYTKTYEKYVNQFEKSHEAATKHEKVTGAGATESSSAKTAFDLDSMKSDDIIPGTGLSVDSIKYRAQQKNLGDDQNAYRGLGYTSKGAGFAAKTAIDNEAAKLRRKEELGDASDILATSAGRKADTHSLMNLQKQADAAISFEETAKKNFDLALQLAPKAVPDLGPWMNKWVQEGKTAVGGEDVPPYVAALMTGANEYAKIMSGSTGAQGSTVDSRREAMEIFSRYLNTGQIKSVIDVAQKDMDNRKTSYTERLDNIKSRIRSEGKPKEETKKQGNGESIDAPLPAPKDKKFVKEKYYDLSDEGHGVHKYLGNGEFE